MYAAQALTLYFMVYWVWVGYVGVGQGAQPNPELWSRFFSAGALVFYVYAAAFLWVASRTSGSTGDE